MAGEIELRGLGPSHFDALRDFEDHHFPGIPYSRKRLSQIVSDPNFIGVGAFRDACMIGAAYGIFYPEEKRVHLLSTIIAADARGHRIGRRLWAEAERRFVEAGATWCHGECITDATDPLGFWTACGFHQTGGAEKFYPNYESALLKLPIWRTEFGRRLLEHRRLCRLLRLRPLSANFIRKDFVSR
jgi:ribosomal protein S18 acetylase RimI-like enzyme